MAPRRTRLAPLLTAAAAVAFTGCITGERPTLADAPGTSGDPAVDAVLELLDGAAAGTFTAEYRIDTALGVTAMASVSQQGPTRRAVTIGSVRYLTTTDGTSTCDVDQARCDDGLDAARISDLQVTPDLDAVSPAARLRTEAGRATGPTVATSETIAGQDASCITVPLVPSGTTVCALHAGPLARLVAADVRIELTSFGTEVSEEDFAPPG